MTAPQGWAAPDGTPPPAGATGTQPPDGTPPPAGGAPQQGWAAPPGWGGPPPARGAAAWGAPAPPEVQPGVVPLRPLGLGELLDGAVGVVRRYPRPTLGLSAVVAVVTSLLNVPLLVSLFDSPLLDPAALEASTPTDVTNQLGGLAAGFGASSLLSFLAGVVLAGIITAVVGKAVLGQPMGLGEAFRAVRPLLLRLVGLAVVVLVAVWGLVAVAFAVVLLLAAAAGPVTLLLGVPLLLAGIALGVYLYVRLALAPSVMVLERADLRGSLRRSGVLVRGSWWRVCGVLLLVLLVTSFVSQVLQTPFAARSLLAGGLTGTGSGLDTLDVVLSSVGSAVALTVVAPFGAAVSALLYVDRRMRAEGLDVALTAAAGSRPA